VSTPDSHEFDVAIIGGGIGGATLAAILARHGVRVLMIEGGGHPRFAIGESTIPETILGLRILARRYDVPELAHLSAHGPLRRNVSTASGVKRNFSFVYHREGEPVRATECTQYPTWGPPIGPDSHFFRQDVDAYLFQVALSYGAVGVTNTPVTEAKFDADGVTLRTAAGARHRARYLVDAGGMRSLLGEQLQLRLDPPPYQTKSRTIFSHFIGVEPFDRVAPPAAEHKMPSPFAQGTLHHLFKGGWVWVIPFDNYTNATNKLCSVGINLDLDEYPRPKHESPEEEFWAHVARFPDFQRQMSAARAVRPFTATDRTQFASRQVMGDRWCLLPHASDFIDPMFSSGLAVTVMALNALGHRLIRAVRDDNFDTARFEYVETWIKRSFSYYDNLVGYSYTAFDDFELWNAWFRVWTICTLYGANGQMQAEFAFNRSRDHSAFDALEREPYRGLQGNDNPHCAALFTTACAAMQSYRDKEIDATHAAERIYTALRESRLVPSIWGTLDPENRCPAGTFTLPAMARILLWGRFASPEHIRGKYFTGGARIVLKEAARFYVAEWRHTRTTSRQALRDMVFTRNRDWRGAGR
jgi:FADH2 O2-dependent halogenase